MSGFWHSTGEIDEFRFAAEVRHTPTACAGARAIRRAATEGSRELDLAILRFEEWRLYGEAKGARGWRLRRGVAASPSERAQTPFPWLSARVFAGGRVAGFDPEGMHGSSVDYRGWFHGDSPPLALCIAALEALD